MKNILMILTSPPASGKTFWIQSFAESCSASILVISPLRALRDECHENWKGKIQVVTPEEWLRKRPRAEVVIFDESHLHFYWGDTFRPILWETFYELAEAALLTIFLTATLSQGMREEIEKFRCHFDDILWIDVGNQKLKHRPGRYVRALSKEWLSELILLGPQAQGTNLIFCAYREEVREWERRLKAKGFSVWGCVGGEAKHMKEKMNSGETPQFIVATSVLSHGVNLPPIGAVFLLYPLKNLDFWIQMVARGGRRGQGYQVFALEDPEGIRWNWWINLLAIFFYSFKMRLNRCLEQWDQWFLKASS